MSYVLERTVSISTADTSVEPASDNQQIQIHDGCNGYFYPLPHNKANGNCTQ